MLFFNHVIAHNIGPYSGLDTEVVVVEEILHFSLSLGMLQVEEEKREEAKRGEDEAERLQGEELSLLQMVRTEFMRFTLPLC